MLFRVSPFLMHFYLLTCTHADKALCINDVILHHYWQSEWTDAVLAGQRCGRFDVHVLFHIPSCL